MRFLPFIWRQLLRNKIRTALTCGAIALAVTLVCLLLTMPAGLDMIINRLASNTRVVVQNEAGYVYPLPYAYLQKVRALPGVVAAASWTWYGGVFDVDKGITFPSFAIEPDPIGTVWEDWGIDPQQLEAFRRYRDGAIVGRGTMNRQGWKIGDLITLKGTIFPVDVQLRIVGEIPNERAPHLWFQREYLDQALRAAGLRGLETLDSMWIRVDDPARVGPLLGEIDGTFHNSEAETVAETEKSYFTNIFSVLQGFVVILLVTTSLVALCIVFIAANTAGMSVRERIGEVAVMKAIGFRRRLIFATLAAEAVLLCGIGGVIGAGTALAITQILRTQAPTWDSSLGPLGSFIVTHSILVQGLLLSLAVGVAAGVVPAFGAARRRVSDVLREVY